MGAWLQLHRNNGFARILVEQEALLKGMKKSPERGSDRSHEM
jgi:hypothetical protein